MMVFIGVHSLGGAIPLLGYVQKDPGWILGPIAALLGFFMNLFFEVAAFIGLPFTLAVSIVLLTIFSRILMLPLGFKSQKSMMAMQRVQPEVEKIKKKYTGATDPEQKRKMNIEIQALYTKNKINPFAGCLPLIIQLPIFFALIFMVQNSYMYINKINQNYTEIVQEVMQYDNGEPTESTQYMKTVLLPIGLEKLNSGSGKVDPNDAQSIKKIFNKFEPDDWTRLQSDYNTLVELKASEASEGTGEILTRDFTQLNELLNKTKNTESIFGLNLVVNSGLGWPGVIIPLLTAFSSFLQSYIMMKQNKNVMSESAQMQQKLMLVLMPAMMLWFTIISPVGVGIYWISSTVFAIFQQLYMNKRFNSASDVVSVQK